MKINPDEDILATDFIIKSERAVTKSDDYGRVPQLESDGYFDPEFIRPTTPVVKKYILTNVFGSSTSRFDITNPSGTTFRYTWDGTGTDPVISLTTVPVGTALYINGQNFNAANKGAFVTTAAGANYFEITNAAGVAENDKTLGTGAINYCWIKQPGLKYVEVETQDAGNGGYDSSSHAGSVGGASSFGAYVTNAVGDILIPGGRGATGLNNGSNPISGHGGNSMYGFGGKGSRTGNGGDGNGYGSGGGGGTDTSANSGGDGGDAGPYAKKILAASAVTDSVVIIIGIGGVGATAGNDGGKGADGAVFIKETYI